jgi:rhodanese-related sulfurtransferase
MLDITLREFDVLATGASEWALFDIRETGEADAGHIFGASFLPRRQIELRIADLVPGRNTIVVVYDEGGPRARLGAETLKRLSYRDVRVLQGGTRAWISAGRELMQGSNVPSKVFGEEVYEHDQVPQLPVAKLRAWRDEGRPHFVCDIRTPDEYAISRIPGAAGAFGMDLIRVADDLRSKGVPIVVHCAGRTRSIIACQTLRALGVKEVYALENGTMGWQVAGLELEKGKGWGVLDASPASIEDGERRARELGQAAGVTLVNGDELGRMLAARATGRKNVYVLDVRQLAEYQQGHIEGSTAVPGGLAIQRTDEFTPVRAAHTVLVDDREGRAFLTGYWFRRSGRPYVHVLAGGLDAWRATGRKVVAGRGRSQPLGAEEAATAAPRITPASLVAESAPLVINVDTSRYFANARVSGSIWIPYGWLEVRIAEHAPNKDSLIVLTCHDGLLSGYAAANLARLGYSQVRVLEGGVGRWAKEAFPTDSGWPTDWPAPSDLVVPPYHSSIESMARYLDWEQKLTAKRRAVASNC